MRRRLTFKDPVVIEFDGEEIVWHGPRKQIAHKGFCRKVKARSAVFSGFRYQGIYSPVPFMPEADCKHGVTMCKQCEEDWGYDYAILDFPTHGDRGYCLGCRCETCINVRNKHLSNAERIRAWETHRKYKYLMEHPEQAVN